jgi:hypothetical protein
MEPQPNVQGWAPGNTGNCNTLVDAPGNTGNRNTLVDAPAMALHTSAGLVDACSSTSL